jgi:hypothetical protein
MRYRVILSRTIVQSAYIEVEAEDFDTVKAQARQRHDEGLEWDDDAVHYGIHVAHGPGTNQEFSFDK